MVLLSVVTQRRSGTAVQVAGGCGDASRNLSECTMVIAGVKSGPQLALSYNKQ